MVSKKCQEEEIEQTIQLNHAMILMLTIIPNDDVNYLMTTMVQIYKGGSCYHKSHNLSVLLYHYACSAKYRRVIFDDSVNKLLIQTCKEIVKRYEINIIELGTDGDHVHFLCL